MSGHRDGGWATRNSILDSALALARDGKSISLDSAAKASGLTKAGLMYHFRTKAIFMRALVDRLIETFERELLLHLAANGGREDSPSDRFIAYLDWASTATVDAANLIMFSDPRLRRELTAHWANRVEPWVTIPDGLPRQQRVALLSIRLLADGMWFGAASDAHRLEVSDRAAVRRLGRELLDRAKHDQSP